MTLNILGPIAALTAFFSIWFGHVAVRKIEAISTRLWIPSLIFVVLGIACEWFSLSTFNLQLAIITGILGITLLFDAFELKRQERRIIKGHAPANPNNPRHAAILAEPNSHATTRNLLAHEPTGKLITDN